MDYNHLTRRQKSAPNVRCTDVQFEHKNLFTSPRWLSAMMSSKLLVPVVHQSQCRIRLLSNMLSPLLQTVPVYPPPAQYNDISGYSIPVPPPHFTLQKANLSMSLQAHTDQVMSAIVVHRFVKLYSLSRPIQRFLLWYHIRENFHHNFSKIFS